jgi:hypothetical protein
MNRNILLLFLSISIFNFIGCATVQTHIDNRDAYIEIPIETQRRSLFIFDHSIGNYRIEDRNRTVNIFEGNTGRILIREGFTFFFENIPKASIEFIQRETSGIIFTTVRQILYLYIL